MTRRMRGVSPRRMEAAARCLAALLLSSALGGCQTFVPVERAAVAPGLAVRVTLTSEEAVKQAEVIGELTRRIEGKVTDQHSADVLALTIPSRGATPAAGNRFNTFLSLPWGAVVRLERKETSWGRTGALAAVGALVTVAILSVTEGSTAGGPGEGPGGDGIRSFGIRLHW